MRRLSNIDISLDAKAVLEGQGIDPARARPGLVESAEAILPTLPDLLDGAAIYDILPVLSGSAELSGSDKLSGSVELSWDHKTIRLEGGLTFEGPLVARALKGAEKVAIAVCTIGPALEAAVKELFADDPVQAMALDGAGVAALREVSWVVIDEVRGIAADRGWGSGMRAQPGQEGWSIWQQRAIFGHLPGDEIGVRLSDSCLMVPQKSVSFVIGMGPGMRPDAVACDFCSRRERCHWRVRA
jgi:hypothetical protein